MEIKKLTPSNAITTIADFLASNRDKLTEDEVKSLEHAVSHLTSRTISVEIAGVMFGEVQRSFRPRHFLHSNFDLSQPA